MVQLRLNVELKSRPLMVMKTNLNDQVALVTAKVLAVKVWNREIPSLYEEGKTRTFKEVQLHLDEELEANTEKGVMTSVGVLWQELKQAVRMHKLGKAMIANLPKLEDDIMQQAVADDKNRPDAAFAAHVAPLLVGATVNILVIKGSEEVVLESGEVSEKVTYKRMLATPRHCDECGVAHLDGDVINPDMEYKIKSAIKYFEDLGEEKYKKQLEELREKLAEYMLSDLGI